MVTFRAGSRAIDTDWILAGQEWRLVELDLPVVPPVT